MIDHGVKVTNAPLPYGEALAHLDCCDLYNRENSDSEFFAAQLAAGRKIQNLNLFSAPSLLQGKSSDSEFIFSVGSGIRKQGSAYRDYRPSTPTDMRELKM